MFGSDRGSSRVGCNGPYSCAAGIHADDHRSPCRLACHACQCPGTVSGHDADTGRTRYRAGSVRDGRPRSRRNDIDRSISFKALDAALLDALIRLVTLLDEPALAPRLAPLIQQEITIRLLTGPHGPQLRRLVTAGSPSQQIAKAVAWLRQNFVEALHGDDLADRAHMSPSTFRQHFRALTGLSPLRNWESCRLRRRTGSPGSSVPPGAPTLRA